MERQYIVRELENVAGRLRKEADAISRISQNYFDEYGRKSKDDQRLAGLVSSKADALLGVSVQIETLNKLIERKDD